MARRRMNGEGTIVKRKDGRYEAALYVPTVNGGTKRVHLYGRTQAEAREKLVAKQQELRNGKLFGGMPQRLDEYLDYWLEQVILPSKRPSTHADYKWYVVNFLKPGLGSYTFDKLTVSTLQTWLNQIYQDRWFLGPTGKSYKVSADRIKKICKVLSTALSRAEREELVSRNVAQKVDLPSYQPKERDPWSADEVRRFLAIAVDHKLYPAFLVLVLYGLRRGEVLGLRWGDVDFEQGILRIRNHLSRGGGVFRQGPPKTPAAIRDLPLLPPVRKVLLDLGTKIGALRQPPSPESLVFVTELGQPCDPDAFRVSFQRLAKRNGLPKITVHDVRHTMATLLKDSGVPDRDIQLMLGHADITTTLQIYQHATMENRKIALEKIETAILPAVPNDVSEAQAATGAHCRQLSSNQEIMRAMPMALLASSTSVISWYTRQDSNLRPLAPQFKVGSLPERVTEVKLAISVCARQWLLGVVVVKIVVSG